MWKNLRVLLASTLLVLISACDFLPGDDALQVAATDRTSEFGLLGRAGLDLNATADGPGGLTVMTRNLYVGTDVAVVLSAQTPAQIPILAAQAFQTVLSTNFAERAQSIAGEIAATQPHVIGLQETMLFRLQSPGDAVVGGTTPAQSVIIDYLEILMQAIQDHGLDYRVAGSVQNMDVELPMLAGTDPLRFDDIRVTGFDVILVRGDVETADVEQANFQARLVVPDLGVTLPRGYVAVDATIQRRSYRVVNTHLEAFSVAVQRAQAVELIAALESEANPVVLLGDMNSPAPDGETYRLLMSEGFVDAWTVNQRPQSGAGFTCCQAENLRNPASLLYQRIDLILFRSRGVHPAGELRAAFAELLGEEPEDRTPSGLWPSDHAGVAATLRIPASAAF